MLTLNYSVFLCIIVSIAGMVMAYLHLPSLIVFLLSLLPAVLIFKRNYYFLLYIFSAIILLYPIETHPSCFIFRWHVHVVDMLFLLYLFLFFFFYSEKSFLSFTLPAHPVIISLIVFVSYNVIQLFNYSTPDGINYGVFELRKYFYVLAVFFIIYKSNFHFKKMIIVLFFIIFLTNIGGIVNSAGFLYRYLIEGQSRIESRHLVQISFYFSQCFLICIIGLGAFKQKRIRTFLLVSAFITGLSMIIDQTRGFWLSTLISLCLYLFCFTNLKKMFSMIKIKHAILVALITLTLIFGLRLSPAGFIKARFGDIQPRELIDPTSSIGYRVYESSLALSKTNIFGHGLKAPVYLYLPWEKKKGFWYGIHSQYVEILYCLGIVGFTLFCIFAFLLIFYAIRIAKNKNRYKSFFGKIVLMSFINTLIISISSGFFNRFSSCLFLGYAIALLVIFEHKLKSKAKA